MKTIICYPIPMDNPPCYELFRPFIKRFADSLVARPPGVEYELAAIVNSRSESLDGIRAVDDLDEMFKEIPWKRYHYKGGGCDIGSFQWFAKQQEENVFQVNCVTRVYAWKEGWLKRLCDLRDFAGPGLYGTCASKEGGHLHLCTRTYAFDTDDFKKYPHEITSRDQGVFFELGGGCLFDWFTSIGRKTTVVYWKTNWILNSLALALDIPNAYRNGDQSNMLVFDRHTDAYRDAGDTEKRRLERMCFNGELL